MSSTVRRKMPLGRRLLITFLCAGAIPATVVMLFSVQSGGESLRHDAFNMLTAISEVKRSAVERYLDTVRKQMQIFAQDKATIEGMADFRRTYRQLQQFASISDSRLANMKSSLKGYYENQFGALYAERNGARPQIDTLLNRLSDNSVALQYAYISANPNPLGEKHKLDTGGEGFSYDRIHARIHPSIRAFLEAFGYYDIFLVDAESGMVVYTVFKELDYATSLKDGSYANSKLGEVYQKAIQAKAGTVVMSDFARYFPSYEAAAGFVAAPIHDLTGTLLGVAAFQFPVSILNEIMGERTGLGETGETYLVGSDGLMRSDSFRYPETHSIEASFRNPEQGSVDNEFVRKALAGESGSVVTTNHAGANTLMAYTSLPLGETTWALIAEIDETEAFAPVSALRWQASLILALSVLIVGVLAFVTKRSIMHPLGGEPDEMERVAAAIADGDLTQEFRDRERATGVYAALGTMNLQLRKLVGDIGLCGANIASAAEETSSITAESSQRVADQQRETSAVAAAITEMSSSIQTVAQHASEASSASQNVATQTERGRAVVSRTLEAIGELADKIGSLESVMGTVEQSSSEIGTVLEVIRSIADQTNLLALNAAIEAARAGEQGRGFAVVADEVRNLARKTQEATVDIESMITALQQTTHQAVQEMKSGRDLSSQAVAAAGEADAALGGIYDETSTMSDMNLQIASAAEQQSQVAEEINANVERINGMAEDTARGAQQTADASHQLAALSEQLIGLVQRFRLPHSGL